MAPTIVIPEMALEPDINGVCYVGGTFVINSKPSKAAITKMKIIKKMSLGSMSIVRTPYSFTAFAVGS